MAYEYEGKLLDYASGSKTYEEYKAMTQELQEVYRKAKAWDEILNIDLAQHDEEYADNAMKVVNKFTEGKND
ncbi:hypothetical protein QI303_03230 [Staphylococcus saprophyticus]|uniref:hypothetical protein n=1 Tax=Staphylococcus saprophyticus TaxID=29385 RepID=UPI00076B1971|nr:hypothetical protein [Staphylococcus saprophyticus]AMG33635.1 hypothetical protein AL494_07680 [Staphylococcus saprophyticus]MDW3837906.1 hypothetical protein [Staphylococcus saprophyticus]MDW3991844.1 hypothetical protein [Staphylococcus saprophyticus]MDW4061932.1 hypothetical protein [Staphylococcus saprophyticus]MDW4083665.1 hypothetical protein [Staphylococcus saprophyticus]